jgi:hypothetical protein
MNATETMREHIQRLNAEEAVKHELKKQIALNRIRLLRRSQREQAELGHREKLHE